MNKKTQFKPKTYHLVTNSLNDILNFGPNYFVYNNNKTEFCYCYRATMIPFENEKEYFVNISNLETFISFVQNKGFDVSFHRQKNNYYLPIIKIYQKG